MMLGGRVVGCYTYRITNLDGLKERTGKRAKQMTKQARAPRLQAAKTSIRSHRLTAQSIQSQPRRANDHEGTPSDYQRLSTCKSKTCLFRPMHLSRCRGPETPNRYAIR